jgi:DNA-binding transcriptional LysR family regulator
MPVHQVRKTERSPDVESREGIVFRPPRDAPPVAVHLIWRRHDPHPDTRAAVSLLSDLYRAQR